MSGNGVPSRPMFLISNTAACTPNACDRTPDNAILPQTTAVQYVHISD